MLIVFLFDIIVWLVSRIFIVRFFSREFNSN
jgi:hypothetical protein